MVVPVLNVRVWEYMNRGWGNPRLLRLGVQLTVGQDKCRGPGTVCLYVTCCRTRCVETNRLTVRFSVESKGEETL